MLIKVGNVYYNPAFIVDYATVSNGSTWTIVFTLSETLGSSTNDRQVLGGFASQADALAALNRIANALGFVELSA
jgi:hypothetical protein